jgi:hypothetical protein
VNASHFHESDTIRAAFANGSTRTVRVSYLDQHGDSLCFVDATGQLIRDDVLRWEPVSDDDMYAFDNFDAKREAVFMAAYRAADPDVMARTVMVLLVAARMPRRVVLVHGETIKEVA